MTLSMKRLQRLLPGFNPEPPSESFRNSVPIDGSEYAEEYCISEAEVQEDLEAVQSFDRPIEIRIRGPGDRIRGPSQKRPGVVVWLYKSHRRMAPLFTDNLKHSHSLRLEVIERKK